MTEPIFGVETTTLSAPSGDDHGIVMAVSTNLSSEGAKVMALLLEPAVEAVLGLVAAAGPPEKMHGGLTREAAQALSRNAVIAALKTLPASPQVDQMIASTRDTGEFRG